MANITSVDDAISVINDNLDYYTSIEKAYKLYDALNYLVINRPSTSNINGISLSFPDLITLKNEVTQFITRYNKSFFLNSKIVNN